MFPFVLISTDDKDDMEVFTSLGNEKNSEQLSSNNNETKPIITLGKEEKPKNNTNLCNGGPLSSKPDVPAPPPPPPNSGILAMKKEPEEHSIIHNGNSYHPVNLHMNIFSYGQSVGCPFQSKIIIIIKF